MPKTTRKISRTWKFGKVIVTATRYFEHGGYEVPDWWSWDILVSANVRGNPQLIEHHERMDRRTAEHVLAAWRRHPEELLEEVVPSREPPKPYRRFRNWADRTGDPEEEFFRYGVR